MNNKKKSGRMGRPVERIETYKRTSIDFPVSIMQFLATKPNRSRWIIEAIQEKMERESRAK